MDFNSKYKSSEIEGILDSVGDKQDAITDLEEIRQGAAKGATALQEHQPLKTINGESIVGEGNITIPGGSGTITEIKANGTSVATSGVANIPAATTSAYGVTKLTSSTSSASTTLAATASAVKAAYDLANSKVSMSDVNTAIANAITNVINADY